MAWSVGGVLDVEQRFKLHSWMLHTLKLDIPHDPSVHDMVLDLQTGAWVTWKSKVPNLWDG